ncbi:MAG: hypothetical protein HZA60_05005, partial [Deltaproteobacteria bacterium]|nr:hypothetical protein [Deltaproteobacteria bacterium]
MARTRAGWLWALPAIVSAVGGALFFLSSSGLAGVVGGPHDFSSTGPHTQSGLLTPSGSCSACHIPHYAVDNVLWPRALADYLTKLDSRNGSPRPEQNFLLPPSVQCYDCHDFHGVGSIEATSTPALSIFNSSYRPQDILFGFTKAGLGSMNEYNAGPQAGKTAPGYYETNPVGPGGSPNYGANLSAPLSETGGHYFKQDPTTSAGDAFDNGDKLPCRDCHDPHAWDSFGNWQAFFRNSWPAGSQVPGNLGSSAQASSFMANQSTPTGRRSDVNSRKLCVACHGTSDTLPVNFSAINAAYRSAPITAPPATVGEHASTSQTACVACHAHNSISAAESSGGVVCASCHSTIYNGMVSGTSSYHHVMYDNTVAYPNAAPTNSATDANRRCLMCHVDHNIFRTDLNASNAKGRGANLRTAIGDSVSTTAGYDNTDYRNAGNGGLCLSCHTPTTQLSKNQTNQRPEPGGANTHIVVPAVPSFAASVHSYSVNSTMNRDGSLFSGNCVKCHVSNLDTIRFNSLGFSVHNATSNRLLAQFGRSSAGDNLQETFCFGCHSEVGDIASGSGGKSTAGRDWYGASGLTMASSAEKTYKNFYGTGIQSRHPLSGDHASTPSVECENCHNPHLVQSSAGNKVANLDNTLSLMTYNVTDNTQAGIQNRVRFCLACHDGAAPGYANSGTQLVPYTVFIPPLDAARANKSTYGSVPDGANSRAHWSVSGQLQSGTVKACGDCHDQHGSTAKKLLGTYNATDGRNYINGVL